MPRSPPERRRDRERKPGRPRTRYSRQRSTVRAFRCWCPPPTAPGPRHRTPRSAEGHGSSTAGPPTHPSSLLALGAPVEMDGSGALGQHRLAGRQRLSRLRRVGRLAPGDSQACPAGSAFVEFPDVRPHDRDVGSVAAVQELNVGGQAVGRHLARRDACAAHRSSARARPPRATADRRRPWSQVAATPAPVRKTGSSQGAAGHDAQASLFHSGSR